MATGSFVINALVGDPMNQDTGSDFDEFLKDEGILAEVTARARERLLALQLDDMELLRGEIAAWDAASNEDVLKFEKMLVEADRTARRRAEGIESPSGDKRWG